MGTKFFFQEDTFVSHCPPVAGTSLRSCQELKGCYSLHGSASRNRSKESQQVYTLKLTKLGYHTHMSILGQGRG